DERFDEVVSRVISSGHIKDWKAREVLDELQQKPSPAAAPGATAAGKVILFGEHAVVYGRHALALPVADAVRASATPSEGFTSLVIPAWGVAERFDIGNPDGIGVAIALILQQLGVRPGNFSFTVESRLPRAMGLGSSAAIAVALTRAIAAVLHLDIDDERVNAIAFECEKLAHGTPSGVDNTVSTFARPMLFCNDGGLQIETLDLVGSPPIVIACSAEAGFTGTEVAGVRARYERAPARYEALFEEIDHLSLAGAELLQAGNYEELGLAMNICHGLLNAIGVSTPELERMVALARQAGAAGAKLTGAGGGGSVVAMCPGNVDDVQNAFAESGYRTVAIR
ncbi:MAG: mevalonate kinase, partial [Woeseiaceae bacterium]|nr:mevalonate kinase [Woeseiaceae bacterium]